MSTAAAGALLRAGRITRVILTGEYPPQPGGVSAYTHLIATGLARAGEEVHVFAPAAPGGPAAPVRGVEVRRLSGCFGARSLRELSRSIDALPRPRRLLVQYVPHAFGWKALNVPLCAWLAAQREPFDVMFHEVACPWRLGARGLTLAIMHRGMAAILARGVDRVYVSTPAWAPLLRHVGVRQPITWLPVPSNLPVHVDAGRVRSVRERLLVGGGGLLIGHFGTHGGPIALLVARALEPVLCHWPHSRFVLIGRGSESFRTGWVGERSSLATRVHATGAVSDVAAAEHLAACDLLVQPYPDGVTTRRGSFMAGLALGVTMVTNEGPLTEPLWRRSRAVALSPTLEDLALLVTSVIRDTSWRRELGRRGAALYRARFTLDACVNALHAPVGVARSGAEP